MTYIVSIKIPRQSHRRIALKLLMANLTLSIIIN